jgi:phage terminase large subunit-like protein
MKGTLSIEGLHPGQEEIAASVARYKVLACGRRWGKTRLAVALCIAKAWEGKAVWWIAPTYPLSQVAERSIRAYCADIGRSCKMSIQELKSARMFSFPSGGHIQIRSADNPDSLRSEGIDYAVFDEAAFAPEDAWTHAVRPALVDREGEAIFISTPRGMNWFFQHYQRGQEGIGGWASWSFSSYTNPFIKADELDKLRDDMPERIFRQEVLGEFVNLEGTVFRNIRACVYDELPNIGDPEYIIAADWGKIDDYNVFTVFDTKSRTVVEVDRSNKIDYMFQVKRLKALAEKYRAERIIAETNSMGEPLIENLRALDLSVDGITTTAITKKNMIEQLALAFERGEIAIPDYAPLVNELMAFEAKRTPSGNLQYGVQAGHDDCVMSLALAYSALGGGLRLWGF